MQISDFICVWKGCRLGHVGKYEQIRSSMYSNYKNKIFALMTHQRHRADEQVFPSMASRWSDETHSQGGKFSSVVYCWFYLLHLRISAHHSPGPIWCPQSSPPAPSEASSRSCGWCPKRADQAWAAEAGRRVGAGVEVEVEVPWRTIKQDIINRGTE